MSGPRLTAALEISDISISEIVTSRLLILAASLLETTGFPTDAAVGAELRLRVEGIRAIRAANPCTRTENSAVHRDGCMCVALAGIGEVRS